ncbi:hypothetical protein RMATCC62417_08808 [Rhizopus microsporus]|nr:hypothetical protein RMATCC62417_08808 [Rhizopus microsporus]
MLFSLIGKCIHIIPTLKQLQAELPAAKAEIARLQQQNASLRERLAQVSPATELPAVNLSAVTRPPESPWKRCRPTATKPLPSQAAAARTFSHPSANQDFKYLYIPVPTNQLRSRLRRLHVHSSRILDIHYPDRHLVILLIHNDYESEPRSRLNKFAITVRDEYDLLHHANLRDPVRSKWNHQDRADYAFSTFADRLIRAIRRIRTPVQRAVARFFVEKGFFFWHRSFS